MMQDQPPVVPCLLLQDGRLVRTLRFQGPRYIGDPLEAVRMFNRTEAPGLILMDTTASRNGNCRPCLDLISRLSDESFLPLAYGGGIRTLEDIRDVLNMGIEKVLIGTYAVEDPLFVKQASDTFGRRRVAVAIDAKRLHDGQYQVFTNGGTRSTGLHPANHAKRMEYMGAGEIFINSIDRDGTLQGYDLPLIKAVAGSVSIPVIACGGAGSPDDFGYAARAGASAMAAGSIFVFRGCRRTISVSYPPWSAIECASHGSPDQVIAQGK
jgi:cyclase